jgi:hypothetical protein
MKLNVHASRKDLTGLMIFDFLHAWLHRIDLNQDPDYTYTITDPGDFQDDCVNLLYLDIHANPFPWHQLYQADRYDFIFLDNHSDPLVTSSKETVELMCKFDHTYLVIDSFLHPAHKYFNRHVPVCGDHYAIKEFWLDSRYPTSYFTEQHKSVQRTKDLLYINGANRSWRQYLLDGLKQTVPNLQVISNYNKLVETDDSFFESEQDTQFRNFVNNKYRDFYSEQNEENTSGTYYSQGISVGSHGQFGKIPPGYVIMKEYFEHRCMIFPESTWQNNELALTEKAWKCFVSGSLPMPVGGCNINYLYNQLGLATAWNLLPESMQVFDQVENHQQRYQGVVDAIQWIANNPDSLVSDRARRIVDSNYRQCFSVMPHAKTSEILYNILLTADKK